MNTVPVPTAVSILVLAAAAAAATQEPVYSALVSYGDAVAGGTVTSISNVAVSDTGDWLVHARIVGHGASFDEVVIRNGVVVAVESDPVPSGGQIAVFDSFGITASGTAQLCKLKLVSRYSDYAVFVDGMVALQEGMPVVVPGFSPSTTFGNFFDLEFNNHGEILLNCVVNDPAIPGAPDPAMLRVNAGGGTSATLAKVGDVLPGGRTIAYFSNQPEDTAFNDNGDAMFIARLTGDGSTDQALCLSTAAGLQVLAQKGGPAAGGGTYLYFAQSGLGLNDAGQFVFQATRQDYTSVLVTNAGPFIAEGDPLPGVPGAMLSDLGTFAPAEIAPPGRVLWTGTWGGLNGTTGLFLDHELLLEEGGTSFAGRTVSLLDKGSNAYHISHNGEWVIAQAWTAPGGKETAVLIHMQ